ncbi:MAG TPA: hypothetical protein PK504_11085 [Ferruginibacter sp.]|nr:hypothetical protein [Ferruginibacter sp.]HRE64738.1 hypothetical protein [Ferruginibacter sp.]
MSFKTLIYALACLSFSVVIGAAVYEHVAVVPNWKVAPPVSLSMFQGEYGLNPAPFWIAIHPVTLVLLLASILFFWKTESKKYVLITGIGYLIVLIITFVFFVPELIAITQTTFGQQVDPSLIKRAKLWETLSLVRLSFLIILAIVALIGLTKCRPHHDASY